MSDVAESTEQIAAAIAFSGVVRVDRAGVTRFVAAYGYADRSWRTANTVDTQFGIASGAKGLTALTVVSLIEDGRLGLDTRARELLGGDLPLIDDDVTVEHLLAHRSGIGDYVDEESDWDVTDYVLPIPVHELATTEQYLRVLEGHPHKFRPGERFAYCNSGYVVLALIAERLTGTSFFELVQDRVCEPAGMTDTQFLRSDELPGHAARGYLWIDKPRTNVFHLPVRGSGDGGIYSTVADIHSLWSAMFEGHIVSRDWLAAMIRPRSGVPSERMRYGLGFWVHERSDTLVLEGCDAGASFRSVHDRAADVTFTVISNTSDGAWPVARNLVEHLLP